MNAEGDQGERKNEARCDRCGRPAGIKIGREQFCDECYQLAGSCCMEFGGEDLWEEDEKEASSGAPPADSEERRRRAS